MRSNRRLFCHLAIVLAILFSSAAARAQTASPAASPSPTPKPAGASLEKDFFKNILRDQKAIWTSPAHFNRSDATWVVPVGLATAGFIATDRETGDAMAKHTGQLDASRIISYAGSAWGVGAEAASFYLIGRATHNQRARETGILSAEAIIDSGIVVTVLKEITQRARPQTGPDRSKFFVGGSSFPSGHSIEAWTVATVVAHEYHDHLAVQIAAYGIASAVSISRYTGLHHYLSDVLVGGAMGYGIGRYVYRAHHRTHAHATGGDDEEEEETFSRSKRIPAIEPLYNRRAHDYGVALGWSF
jgi:membrane-associated phospholipid phosphatase